MSSIRSPGSNTPRSTSRSYSTRFQRFIGTGGPGMSESSDSRRRPSTSLYGDSPLRPAEDRPARGHAREIRKRRGLDPVAARLHGPGLEPQARDRGGVAIEPVIGVTHERVERLALGTLDTAKKILAQGDALRKSLPRRHEGVEHGDQQGTLRLESLRCHDRLRIIPSAMWSARA